MRLSRLDLTRYGRFTDRSLHFPRPEAGAPDLHVVLGPNESGKSTAFSAWLDLLYGIPPRSEYGFLHPYETMRIAAVLEHGGRAVTLARVKKARDSLLDGTGAALPSTVVDALTGGIDRAGYAAMFSLDVETLASGGEGILRSEGNFGEMLFSASAGLAGLNEVLARLRERADLFHRRGARKNELAEAKARLDDLADRRRALDVDASRYHALVADRTRAEEDHARIARDLAAVTAELEGVQRVLTALPLRAQVQAADAALSDLPDLPPPPEGWPEELAALTRRMAELRGQRGAAEAQAASLARQFDALLPDAEGLALLPVLEAAAHLRSAHDEAAKDLPRRRDEAEALARDIAEVVRRLGQPGRPAAELLAPPDRLAAMRATLDERIEAEAALALARDEADQAAEWLREVQAKLPDDAPGAMPEALALLVERLKARDPLRAWHQARAEVRRTGDALSRQMAALRPFRRDAAALAALDPPSQERLAALAVRLEAAETELKAAALNAARLASEVHRQVAAAEGSGAEDAIALRARREALWSEHRRNLSEATADRFEAAMRRDDRASAEAARREAGMAALGRLRDGASTAAAAEAAARDARAAAQTELDTIRQGSAPDLPAGTSHAELSDWLVRRVSALEAASVHSGAEAAAAAARAQLDEAAAALSALLDAPAGLAYEALLAQAEARLRAASRAEGLHRAASEAGLAHGRRLRALDKAAERAGKVRTRWQSLCEATWITPDTPPDRAGAILDGLIRLDGMVAGADDLNRRIAGMEANVSAFSGAILPLAQAASMPGSDPARLFDDLRRRADAAIRTQDTQQRIAGERADLTGKRRDIEDETARIADRLRQMAAHFTADGAGDPAELIAVAATRAALVRKRHSALQDLSEALQLAPDAALAAAAAQDREALQHRRLELGTARDTLGAALSESWARLGAAGAALSAVGGGDAIARIDSERETLLLTLRERAEAHLRLRFGLLAVDQALLRYRESHRSTMLARASDVFRRITGEAYRGLDVQPGPAGELLVALARDGGARQAHHLSDGTRAQLYLALRIAGYHEFAATRPPVPFIADDIMETFDDDRAARTFEVLAEMAGAGQVIYLTHHAHLAGIARQVCLAARVQSLGESV